MGPAGRIESDGRGRGSSKSFSVREFGQNIDATAVLVEAHNAFPQSEQRVVPTDADVAAGDPARPDLTAKDRTDRCELAAVLLDPATLSVRITTVTAGTLTFFMCHCLDLRIFRRTAPGPSMTNDHDMLCLPRPR